MIDETVAEDQRGMWITAAWLAAIVGVPLFVGGVALGAWAANNWGVPSWMT